MTESQEPKTRYGLEDAGSQLRVVLRGMNHNGTLAELTRLNGDGSGQVTLEYYGDQEHALSSLDGPAADDLTQRAAEAMGVAKPGFTIEAPITWALDQNGDCIRRGSDLSGPLVRRRVYKFQNA